MTQYWQAEENLDACYQRPETVDSKYSETSCHILLAKARHAREIFQCGLLVRDMRRKHAAKQKRPSLTVVSELTDVGDCGGLASALPLERQERLFQYAVPRYGLLQ